MHKFIKRFKFLALFLYYLILSVYEVETETSQAYRRDSQGWNLNGLAMYDRYMYPPYILKYYMYTQYTTTGMLAKGARKLKVEVRNKGP